MHARLPRWRSSCFHARAFAAEPVRHIGLYVVPFYVSAQTPDGQPQVSVGKQYNALLASNKREDILAARDLIVAKPGLVTPMTLMVLAIRFYDVGLRDDAVFWFYVAKERYIVMAGVLDVKSQVAGGGRPPPWAPSRRSPARSSTATPSAISPSKKSCTPRRSIGWRPTPTRSCSWRRRRRCPATARKTTSARSPRPESDDAKERAYFDDPKTVEVFYTTRKRNEADVKFCWK